MSENMSDGFPQNCPIKRLCLYQSDTKKNINRTINPKNYDSREEFDKFVEDIIKANKQRNARIRAAKKKEEGLGQLSKITDSIQEIQQPDEINNPQKDISTIQESCLDLKLDPDTGSSICIIGQSKSGKSHLLMDIYLKYFMENKKWISTLFCDNPQLSQYKAKRLKIAKGFNEDQQQIIKSQHWLNTKTKNRYRFLNILDDIVEERNSVLLKKLILTFRNSFISSIIVLQYLFLMSKGNRNNINHFFIFKVGSAQISTEIINHILKPYFQQMKIPPNEMSSFFMNMTKDNHSYIYINNQKNQIHFIKGN